MTFMVDRQIFTGFDYLIVHTFWLFKWKDDRICVIVINTGQNIVLILDIADLIIHLIISALEFSDKFIRLFQDSCIRFISDFLINIVAVRKFLSENGEVPMMQGAYDEMTSDERSVFLRGLDTLQTFIGSARAALCGLEGEATIR